MAELMAGSRELMAVACQGLRGGVQSNCLMGVK